MKKTFAALFVSFLFILSALPAWAADADKMDPSMPGMTMDQSNSPDGSTTGVHKKAQATLPQDAAHTPAKNDDKSNSTN